MNGGGRVLIFCRIVLVSTVKLHYVYQPLELSFLFPPVKVQSAYSILYEYVTLVKMQWSLELTLLFNTARMMMMMILNLSKFKNTSVLTSVCKDFCYLAISIFLVFLEYGARGSINNSENRNMTLNRA